MTNSDVHLLVRHAYEVFSDSETHLTTKELLSRIAKLDPEASWISEWSTLQAASMHFSNVVGQYSISPKRYSIDGKQLRGYAKRDFASALGKSQSQLPDWV